MRRRCAPGATRWLAGAALACSLMGPVALSQAAPPVTQAAPPAGSRAPQPSGPQAQTPSAPEWPALPATLPPYDEGLRSIVGFAEEGRGDEALLWTLAYLGQELPGATSAAERAGSPLPEAGDAPAPALPQWPTAPELTEAQRASLHYALAVILAGAPTTEAPADPAAAELMDARERWALEQLAQAEGLAGRGRVRSDANFNRGALHTWRGERSFLGLLREVAASGGGTPPFPEDSPQREALIATRAEFAAGRDAALDGLRLGWERLAAGLRSGADDDLRANLEFCQRRLRQIDRLLELPPEEEPPPEQEQQEDKEDSEDSEDSQDSEDSEDENSQQGESEESESEEDSQQSEQDSESEGDSQSESPSESSEGDPQEDRPDSQGDPDPESLEEREPPPAEPPSPDEDGQLDEQASQEAPAEGEPSEQPEAAPGEQPEGGDTEEAQSGAGQAGQEPPLSEEQVIQLLRRLADIEKDQERLRALIRGAQRVPVEKDW